MGSVILLKKSREISSSYLSYFIKSPTGQLFIRGVTKGMAVNALYLKDVKLCPMPIPPIAEQHRIVAKVDELMALCDQLEAQAESSIVAHKTLVEVLLATFTDAKDADKLNDNWQTISQHFDVLFTTQASIDQLKQTILQLAVMGKLVKQDPKDEPASKLLERIATEKQQLIKDKKYQKSSKLKPKINSVKYPINWVEVQTGEVCPSIVPNRDRPKSFTGKIPWVTLPSFPKNSWYLRNDDVELGLTSDEIKLYSARLIPKNSVLMSCVGRFGLTAINLEPVSSNQQVHAFIVLDGLIPEYLSIVIQTAGRALESASTTTTIPYLNKTNCESIQFGLPPIAEQHRIVSKVDDLMALCDSLKARLNQAQTIQLHLTDAIVEQGL
jgi:type I restriction enzyme S subunit